MDAAGLNRSDVSAPTETRRQKRTRKYTFFPCDAVDARIFSKGGEAGGIAVTSAKDKFPSERVWIEYEAVR